MNITERISLEGIMENRGVSSPKSAVRLAYLRALVEEGTLPERQEKPVMAVSTLPEGRGRENVREKKKRVKWGKGRRWRYARNS